MALLFDYMSDRMSESEWAEHVAEDPLLADILERQLANAPSEDFKRLTIMVGALLALGLIITAFVFP